MKWYIIMRLAGLVPVLLGISAIAFFLVRLVPCDPAEVYLRLSQVPPTPEMVAAVRADLGLDRPLHIQYLDWLHKALQLDFGLSFATREPVLAEIMRCFPATLQLTLASMALVLLISLPAGILAALYKDGVFDQLSRVLAFLGASVPNFWLGFMLMYLFSLKLDLLPVLGRGTAAHLALPAVTLAMSYAATYTRLLRTSMLDSLGSNFVLYTRARGLRERLVLGRHVLKNALLPVVTAFGMSAGHMLAGTVIVENIFAWPGMGMLCVSSIFNRDYPVIQCYALIMALIFVACNLAVDIAYRFLDPRIRLGGGR